MPSAAFTINGGSSPQATAAGATVTLALSSVTGVGTVEWSIIGGSNSTKTAPTITPAGTPSGATATFTMNSAVGNVGLSWVVRCRINGGVDANGATVAGYTNTGIVGVNNTGGFLPFAYGESLERNSTSGIADDLNAQLGALGSLILASVSSTGNDTSNTHVSIGTLSAKITRTLPASPAAGDVIEFKAPSNASSFAVTMDSTGRVTGGAVTISGNGKTIDGQTALVLYLDYSAVKLLYNGTEWEIS